MTKESLSDKMFETLNETGKNVIWIEDVKEKIQNVQRRLHIFLCSKIEGEILLPKKDIKEIYNKTDKIFLEEFGEKLIR